MGVAINKFVGLEILNDMSQEELDLIVHTIIDKGSLTETLTTNELYKKYQPNHRMYLDAIQNEILAFGSHTFGSNKSYIEIVRDVCKKMKVPFNPKHDLEHLEHNLLETVLEKTWESMEPEEQRKFLSNLNEKTGIKAQASAAALIGLFRAGGFASYQLLLLIANQIAIMILGRGLSLAANAALVRAASIFAGPIGMALTAVWTVFDLAGPAYRVTIPIVIYIAAIRAVHNNDQFKNFAF